MIPTVEQLATDLNTQYESFGDALSRAPDYTITSAPDGPQGIRIESDYLRYTFRLVKLEQKRHVVEKCRYVEHWEELSIIESTANFTR